jgi:L-threonylcarbamoyladenylate synthase
MTRILGAEEPASYLLTALAVLRRSGVVALPTETVYGLAASLLNSLGVDRIFALKGRPDDRPLPVQFFSLEAAQRFGFRFSDGACRLARTFWPGPLTLVLERPKTIPEWFAPGADGIAVRVPGHPVALALLRGFGNPLAATSANPSGEPPALDARTIAKAFPEAEDLLILDGGPSPGGEASNVVDGRRGNPSLRRPGPISWESIEEAWKS